MRWWCAQCRHLCVCSGCTQALAAAAISTTAAAPPRRPPGLLSILSSPSAAPMLSSMPKPPTPRPAQCPVCRDKIEDVLQISLAAAG